MKFRKKSIIIEAEQWFPGKEVDGVMFNPLGQHLILPDEHNYFVNTINGWVRVDPGDWIITDTEGNKYPCKPNLFNATYEPVDETPGEIPPLRDVLRAVGDRRVLEEILRLSREHDKTLDELLEKVDKLQEEER